MVRDDGGRRPHRADDRAPVNQSRGHLPLRSDGAPRASVAEGAEPPGDPVAGGGRGEKREEEIKGRSHLARRSRAPPSARHDRSVASCEQVKGQRQRGCRRLGVLEA